MNQIPDPDRAQLRWSVYLLLITLAVGNMVGRIFAVNSVDKTRLESYRISKAVGDKKKRLIKEGVEGDQLTGRLEEYQAKTSEKLRLQRPFLSSNDRSRWCMIRSLVEHGTYEIDEITHQSGWDTIDMVKHKGSDGRWHLYSSKPPLLPTLMAGEYWLIHRLTGRTLETHPYEIGRFMVITLNVLPMIVYFLLLAKLIERYGRDDWSRLFVMAAATFGTFLPTYAIVLNNHLPAAICVLFTLYATMRIWIDQRPEWRYFATAGLFSALAVANELPAASLAVATCVGLGYRFPKQTFKGFVPAATLVAVAFFATNYVAHETLLPPYAHRRPGEKLFEVEGRGHQIAALNAGKLPPELREKFKAKPETPLASHVLVETITPGHEWRVRTDNRYLLSLEDDGLKLSAITSGDTDQKHGDQAKATKLLAPIKEQSEIGNWREQLDQRELPAALLSRITDSGTKLSADAVVAIEAKGNRWLLIDSMNIDRYHIRRRSLRLDVFAWGNWYDYSFWRSGRLRESHWRNPGGIDSGEPLQSTYALHVLIGHHGIFSLTPIWMLSFVGIGIMAIKGSKEFRAMALLIGAVSVVCIGFYLARPLADRNYGGMTSAFRWAFWMMPLWLVAMLPALEMMGRRRSLRGLAIVLLGMSALSAAYPTWNPWTHPWIMNLMLHMDWVQLPG